MAEANGSGRMDRIEAALERLEAAQERDHEEFTRDHKQLMTWQVLMQEKMERFDADRAADREDGARERKRLDQLWENTDKRIADLVGAIGSLIKSSPNS
jgi:hypothetical protein